MPTSEASQDSRRFASDVAGVIHEVTGFKPRTESYVAACGQIVPAKSADVWRAKEPPGVLCRQCGRAAEDAAPAP